MKMAKLADRLIALDTMAPAGLRAEWERLGRGSAPALPLDLLRRLVAYALQEKRHGGLPAAVARELARVAGGGGSEAGRPPPSSLRPGTRLVREWNGRTISVLAIADGFLWEERTYASLTAIAREVTGARWSGPRFFGLTSRG